MSNDSSQQETSYVTDLSRKWPRTITEYMIPGLGLVRCQSLNQGDLAKIRTFPPAMQYAAAIASILVDEHGDTTMLVNDETLSEISQMDSRVFDAFVDIINGTILNNVSVEDMVKN